MCIYDKTSQSFLRGMFPKELVRKIKTHFVLHSIYRVSQEECARFGRVFLMLNYTDITQNYYIQS